MKKGRTLLAITGSALITFTGGAAAATGNLMAVEPDPPPPKSKDAGTADAGVPLTKKEPAKKDPGRK